MIIVAQPAQATASLIELIAEGGTSVDHQKQNVFQPDVNSSKIKNVNGF